MLYCFNEENAYDSFTNEIRVVSARESLTDQVTSAVNLNLKTCDGSIISKTSYDPVNWVTSSDDQDVIDNLVIDSVQAIAYDIQQQLFLYRMI